MYGAVDVGIFFFFPLCLKRERFSIVERKSYSLGADGFGIQFSFLLIAWVILGDLFDLCNPLVYLENGDRHTCLPGQGIN